VTTVVIAVSSVVAAAAVAFLLTRSSSDASKTATTGPDKAGPSVSVAKTKLGRILVDAHGHTLYLYLKDHGTRSACLERCLRVWPPATVAGSPTAGPGVVAAKLTTMPRGDSRQLVYNGHPLYTLTSDVRPGQVGGEGFLGTWYVVSAAGNRVGKLKPGASEY
jgi:predicted lipoprotein with Yx(FWY)xxD motif